MAKSLADLTAELKDEPMPVTAMEDLPDFGAFQEPPQPGPYRFQLPAMDKVFELFDTTELGRQVQRLRVIFDRDNALLIKQSPGNQKNGETFQTRLSNVKRNRGKDQAVQASDLDYLLRAFGEKQTPNGNRGYLQILAKASGKEFGADITYSWVCSDQRNIRVQKADGTTEEVQDKKGCGKKYYQRDVAKMEDGTVPTAITCECGAHLRCFSNLDNIRP